MSSLKKKRNNDDETRDRKTHKTAVYGSKCLFQMYNMKRIQTADLIQIFTSDFAIT